MSENIIEQQPNQKILTATVLNGTDVFEVDIDGQGSTLMGLITPPALDSSKMTLQVSADGTTFKDYYTTAGTEIEIQLGVDRYIGFVASDFFPIRAIRFVMDQNETADRIFSLVYRSP